MDEEQQIRQRFSEREITPECSTCKEPYGCFGYLLMPKATRGWDPHFADPELRTIYAKCSFCGEMRLFEAETLGL